MEAEGEIAAGAAVAAGGGKFSERPLEHESRTDLNGTALGRVRRAVDSAHAFPLHGTVPNLGQHLLDPHVDRLQSPM